MVKLHPTIEQTWLSIHDLVCVSINHIISKEHIEDAQGLKMISNNSVFYKILTVFFAPFISKCVFGEEKKL